MKYFQQSLGKNNGTATFYLHEPSKEIDPNKKYPVMVVVPGGAYMWTSDREAEPIASEFFAKDYHAVVVHYDTEGLEAYQGKEKNELPKNPVSVFPNPLVELAEAISIVRKNAKEWAVDEDRISVLGFSAGGNLAGLLGTYWTEDWLEELVGNKKSLYKPNYLVLAYAALDLITTSEESEVPVSLAITGNINASKEKLRKVSPSYHVNEHTPPSFIWHTLEDTLVPANNALKFATAMAEHNRPYELHIYEKGVHGVALGDSRTSRKENQSNKHAASWVNLLLGWLEAQ